MTIATGGALDRTGGTGCGRLGRGLIGAVGRSFRGEGLAALGPGGGGEGMAAELVAEGRDQAQAEGVLLLRREPGEQGRGDDRCRHPRLIASSSVQRPSPESTTTASI